jgi:beta-galactosidase
VSDRHELHVEECGNPLGLPVLVLHGGPGGGAFLHWREKLEGGPVLETAGDGVPAVIGTGPVRYLGGWPDAAARDRLLAAACAAAGIATDPMPGPLRRRDAGGVRFYINYGAGPVTHRGITVPAAGVYWSA